MTATIPTFVKKLAKIEKCDAEPPSILSHLPNGVSTSSYATDPTTKRDMCVIVFDQLVEIVDAHLAELFIRQRLLLTAVETDVLIRALFAFVLRQPETALT